MGNQSMNFEDIIRKLNADDTNIINSENSEKDNTGSIYKTLVSSIISLPPKQYTLLYSVISILLIDNLDVKDQILLGKFIYNIGQTILTTAAQEQINNKKP